VQRTLIPIIVIAATMFLGCAQKPPTPVPADLSHLLANAKQDDIVVNGPHADEVLYEGGGLVVWYRHSTAESSPAYFGKLIYHDGAIYAFSKSRCLISIPVDATDVPFQPTVCLHEHGGVLIGSSHFDEAASANATGISRGQTYVATWYLLNGASCKEVLHVAFVPYPTKGALSYTTFVPYNRHFIAEITWEAQTRPSYPVHATLDAVYRWDSAVQQFVGDAPATSPAPSPRQDRTDANR
jgi:hypothetical protein